MVLVELKPMTLNLDFTPDLTAVLSFPRNVISIDHSEISGQEQKSNLPVGPFQPSKEK